ncbi:hypothetical protein D3C86_1574540 [compost metagenome]
MNVDEWCHSMIPHSLQPIDEIPYFHGRRTAGILLVPHHLRQFKRHDGFCGAVQVQNLPRSRLTRHKDENI